MYLSAIGVGCSIMINYYELIVYYNMVVNVGKIDFKLMDTIS